MSQSTPAYLLIRLLQLQNTPPSSASPSSPQSLVYLSFSITETMYFSSCLPQSEYKAQLNDDILIPVNERAETVEMQRWENHMIMLSFMVELSELKNRRSVLKKIQIKGGQYLKMVIVGIGVSQVKIGYKFIESITQHYLFIDKMELICNQTNKNDSGPSYFKIKTDHYTYIIPVIDAQILLKIPDTLHFSRIKNGKQIGKSSIIPTSQLHQQQKHIPLQSIGGYKYESSIKLTLKWGINLQQPKTQNALLFDAQQIMIYDIDLKFQNYNDFGNTKIKIVYGNKAFELGTEFNNVKSTKVKKIVNLFTKSEEEQIMVIVEKNLKFVAQAKMLVEEITPFVVTTIKKKIIDISGKQIGNFKAKCERAKNLSTPTNNKIWRQSAKYKNSASFAAIVFDQLSVNCEQDFPINLSFKTDAEEKFVENVANFKYFRKNNEVTKTQIAVNLKPQQSIYMIAKNAQIQQSDKSDFVGIALFNPSQCRLGQNTITVNFFKNQIQTLTLNCFAHKIPSYPFIKPSFQPQLLQSLPHRSLSLSIIMRQIVLSPYFYTYRYENKNQVYSIVQVNKIKKVLIMQNRNKNNQLAFNCSASSDNLDFTIEENQNIKIKVTFLVSDVGQDQEIYGWSFIKIKTTELQAASTGLKFYLVLIKNQFDFNLGQINLQVHKATLFNSHMQESRDVLESGKKPIQSEKRKVKMHLAQISQSVELKQKSLQIRQKGLMGSKNINTSSGAVDLKKPSPRYQKPNPSVQAQKRKRNNSVIGVQGSIKLPVIRQQSASPQGKKNYNDLVQMMKIRKRSVKGTYQQNSMLQSYQLKNYNNKSNLKSNYKFDDSPTNQTFHLKQKIQKQNPNLSRNMEILFPKKNPRQHRNLPPRPIRYEEEKLKGLKSVLNQISSDMGEIQPTLRDEERFKSYSKKTQRAQYISGEDEADHLKGPQWEDNQFAM